MIVGSTPIRKVLRSQLALLLMLGLFATPIQAEPKQLTNALGMEFVLIPSGTFTMGSPATEPFRDPSEVQRKVTLTRPFYMQVTEVTVKQWLLVMGKPMVGAPSEKPDMPAVNVSWHDARKFIKKLNRRAKGTYRLPSEAQWEYSARAGSKNAYSWGKEIDCSRAMYANNQLKAGDCIGHIKSRGLGFNQPAPVKSYPPNGWGLYDMHGNVWEWCLDRFLKYGSDPVSDPLIINKGKMRVRRGGSWFKHGNALRSANRAFAHPASRLQNTGFRLVYETK